jgi:hypothetical protein
MGAPDAQCKQSTCDVLLRTTHEETQGCMLAQHDESSCAQTNCTVSDTTDYEHNDWLIQSESVACLHA